MPDDSGLIQSALPGMVWPGLPAAHGSALLALLHQLEETQWLGAERILARQLEQASHVLSHARDTVPFYRSRLAGLHLGGGLDRETYRSIPILTRREIQGAGNAMVSTAVPPGHGALVTTESSGSTGEPLLTVGTQVSQLFWHALLMREHLWQRRDFGGKLVAIRSKTNFGEGPSWGLPVDLVFRTGPSAVLDISTDVDRQVRWLQEQKPDYLISFATNTRRLAQRCLELGVRLENLREARTYGEVLSPDTREIVRAAWGVPVVDSYSSEELGYIALQCPGTGHYHLQAENLLVEVLRDDGSPCAAGETGRVVATTLHNFAMPFVRYANGDYAEVGEACPCGRGLPVVTRIAGRQRNMLVQPDGTQHWPSFPTEIWGRVAPVRQLQFVQDALDHIEVRLVLPRELTAQERADLTRALQECLHYPFRMTLRRVDAIERRRGEKYEEFISLVTG